MFRRRFRRRRRFGGKGVKRKEAVWIQTAYNVAKAPTILQRDLFALVGPEDYTPDYLSEPQRLERSTVVRTVGHFSITPVMVANTSTQRLNRVTFKAALFIAGDKEIDDAFAADPAQFDITGTTEFVQFCRQYSPMHIFWNAWAQWSEDGGTDWGDYWVPPGETLAREWDVSVKRRMKGDDGLWLLINSISQVVMGEVEFGHSIDVESRNLLND